VAHHEPIFRVWRRVCEALAADQYVGRQALLVADDADDAAPATILALSRLVSLDVSAGVRLTTIAGCRPNGLSSLGERMLEQAELLVELEPLSLAETRAYLHGCVIRAGRTDPIFTNAAVLRLHELSDGVLRRLNRLADQALAAGAVQAQVCVDTETVEGVFHELGAATFVRRIA
jgi:type II secretory pathway predicted ATPase ExeA